ncbi:dethiobiotin synthase [Gammaproteobacteria bacterium]|nr:dethiobiotin synthase [Gammaproteobacteria bacterium]
MPKYLFLTGTNTDVGKTFIGTKLIKDLNKKYNYLAFKPIETGCRKKGSELIPADSSKYHSILSKVITLDELNPFRFIPPVSPYLAIKRARNRIYIKDYYEKLKMISKNAPVLLEGAGGAFSPLALDGLNIDLMKMIKSINILIIKDELGCISSAISNVLAFEKYKVRLDLLVLNTQKKNDMDNLKEIKKYTDIPIVNYMKPSDIKTIQNKINKIL